jgi:hypothetical protein
MLGNIVKILSEGKEDDIDEIVIKTIDKDHRLKRLLYYIQDIGNVGHSFDIIVDPDNSDTKKIFGWDGDGSDRIKSIMVNGGMR